MKKGYVCIHAHCYQPPRENPWLEEVEREPSAHPYHDWNSRITAECYRANAFSRVLTDNRISEIMDNYTKMSYNFGPTLLSWMETHEPEVYRLVLEADRKSAAERDGHGNAIAQVYNHSIMPLNSRRDKETQILWGIRDFEYRFGRNPEGIWLAETAVDSETLRIAAEHGIKFTILAPCQCGRVRHRSSGSEWKDVKGHPDTTRPYICDLGEGKSISLFFYDGVLAHSIAFSGALNNGYELGRMFMEKALSNKKGGGLAHIATDGETFGHHHRFGEMGLSAAIKAVEASDQVEMVNYGQYLDQFPPVMEAEIVEESSWSCFHGIERWRSDCGCHTGGRAGWDQKWRHWLREGFNNLKERLDRLFEREAARYVTDPWAARNGYIDVMLDRSMGSVEAFLAGHTVSRPGQGEITELLKLMEMQVAAMKMFTSCGWFFNDISGLEGVQVMKYAAKAIDLAADFTDEPLEAPLLEDLEKAKSNIKKQGNGATAYRRYVQPMKLDPGRVAARTAIMGYLNDKTGKSRPYCFEADLRGRRTEEHIDYSLNTGRITLRSLITFEMTDYHYCLVHTGGHEFNFAYGPWEGEEAMERMSQRLLQAFQAHNLPHLFGEMDKAFDGRSVNFDSLFENDRKAVVENLTATVTEQLQEVYHTLFRRHLKLMGYFREIGESPPEEFRIAAAYVFEKEIDRIINRPRTAENFQALYETLGEAKRWGIKPDFEALRQQLTRFILQRLETECSVNPRECAGPILEAVRICRKYRVKLDNWTLQNAIYPFYEAYRDKESAAHEEVAGSKEFIDLFRFFHFHVL